jgi:adenine-specific DNA-methyltransferase
VEEGLKLVQIEGDVREKVKSLLKELFQFENQDLDFGIHRIMNFKRKEIERFIEKDLLEAAEERFKEYAQVGVADLQKDVERLRAEIVRDFREGTIDEQGNVKKHEDAPKIKEYVGKTKELESARLTQVQMDDVFNHIYEFFSRYYDKGDFISKRRYGGREKYYVPYNGEEVLLHWANNDQYYVKTGEYFKKYSFKAGGYSANFVLREAEEELNNVKDETKYFILCDDEAFKLDEEKKELDIFFRWRALSDEERKKYGIRNIRESIASDAVNRLLAEIGDKGVGFELRRKADEEKTFLEKHLKKYVERNTTDYFIHKNLSAFLERELDFYIKNEVLDLDEIDHMAEQQILIDNAKRRAIERIGDKIIQFLAQIEGFQKILFEKKKFVLRTDYCMTLDLVPEEFYTEISKNQRQVAAWKELFWLDETTKNTLHSTKGKETLDVNFLRAHKHLVLDTMFFSEDFKFKLLESFNNLDESTGGILIKSENLQALNLMLEKYRGNVACIYIDPPYNTGNDEFLYKDNYQHSSWLSLMSERLKLARELLSKEGTLFVSCDDNEMARLRLLLCSIFGIDNFIATVIWEKISTRKNSAKYFSVSHDYVICFAKERSRWKRILLPREDVSAYSNPDNDPKGPWKADPVYANNPYAVDYEIVKPNGTKLKPPRGRFWRFSEERFKEKVQSGDVIWGEGDGYPLVKRHLSEVQEGLVPVTLFDRKFAGDNAYAAQEFRDMFGQAGLISYPKPTKLIQRLVQITSSEDDLVLDFFAGSGTTAHAVLNHNLEGKCHCKYILVEMGSYFDSLLKPRIQKVMYSKEWKDSLPASNNGISHMFKYIYLEQYEDTLNNIVFREKDKTIQETLDSFQDYFLRYMLDYETRDSPTRLTTQKFQTPFTYKIKTINGTEEKEQTVDLVETFNYLLGLKVSKIRTFNDDQGLYHVVYGKRKNGNTVIIWRGTQNLDLEKDKNFIEEKILSGNNYDLIFVNGDSYVKNARPIEPEFKRLMGA